MRFFSFLRFDIINGTKRAWKPFLFGLALLAFTAFDFIRNIGNYFHFASVDSNFTVGELALYLFGGMKNYVPDFHEPFLFPALWLLLFLIVLFSTIYYPYEDLGGFGQQILLYAGGRSSWWLSKSIWNIITVTCHFVIIWAVILITAIVGGGNMSFVISDFAVSTFNLEIINRPENWNITAQLIFAPWLAAMALSLAQMLLSLLIRPVFSLIFSVSYLIASAYLSSPFLLGNYAMIIRDSQIMENGMSFTTGIFFSLGVIIISVLGGLFFFRKYDILARE